MPRYLVERTFADGLHIPMNDTGDNTVAGMIATTRSPLHGKVGAPNGVFLHFTARRVGAYKAVVKVFKSADPTTPVATTSVVRGR